MSYNHYIFNYVTKETIAEYQREAEIERLVKECNPLSREPLSIRILHRLRDWGHSLIAIEQHLTHLRAHRV